MSEDSINPKPDQVEFRSKNITKRPKAEYFVKIKTRKKSPLPSSFNSLLQSPLFKGWRKFAFLAILCVAILTPIVVIKLANQPESPSPSGFGLSIQTATEVYMEAVTVSQGSSDRAFFDALDVFDRAISEHESVEIKNEIIFMKSEFLLTSGNTVAALTVLLELRDSNQLLDSQQARFMSQLISLYRINGNSKEADELLNEYNRLYSGLGGE